jgi:hypothetical protein
LQNAQPATSSSFDQSKNHLYLKDDTKGTPLVPDGQTQSAPSHFVTQSLNQPVPWHTPRSSFVNSASQNEQDDTKREGFRSSKHQAQQPPMEARVSNTLSSYANHTPPSTDDEDVKGGSAMIIECQVQQSQHGMHRLADGIEYNRHAGYSSDYLPYPQGTGYFSNFESSHHTQSVAHNYPIPADIGLFNNDLPVQMACSSHDVAKAASKMDYTCNSKAMLTPMPVTEPPMPQQFELSFGGLPCDFAEPPHR